MSGLLWWINWSPEQNPLSISLGGQFGSLVMILHNKWSRRPLLRLAKHICSQQLLPQLCDQMLQLLSHHLLSSLENTLKLSKLPFPWFPVSKTKSPSQFFFLWTSLFLKPLSNLLLDLLCKLKLRMFPTISEKNLLTCEPTSNWSLMSQSKRQERPSRRSAQRFCDWLAAEPTLAAQDRQPVVLWPIHAEVYIVLI